MFTTEKLIDKNKIRDAIIEKQSMTFEKLEEKYAKEFLLFKETFKEENINQHPQNYEFNVYDEYINWFSTLLFGLTLDELEFINNENLFNLDKNNLLDLRCQEAIDKRIKDFRQTLEDLNHSISIGNVGNYFQKFGDIHDQAMQGIKLKIILGLNRENVE